MDSVFALEQIDFLYRDRVLGWLHRQRQMSGVVPEALWADLMYSMYKRGDAVDVMSWPVDNRLNFLIGCVRRARRHVIATSRGSGRTVGSPSMSSVASFSDFGDDDISLTCDGVAAVNVVVGRKIWIDPDLTCPVFERLLVMLPPAQAKLLDLVVMRGWPPVDVQNELGPKGDVRSLPFLIRCLRSEIDSFGGWDEFSRLLLGCRIVCDHGRFGWAGGRTWRFRHLSDSEFGVSSRLDCVA